jgi:hypothetical protein
MDLGHRGEAPEHETAAGDAFSVVANGSSDTLPTTQKGCWAHHRRHDEQTVRCRGDLR